MPPVVSSDGLTESGTYNCHLLREVRAFCLSRAHLNPFATPRQISLQRKRLAGIRQLTYRDAVNSIRLARREGRKRGLGAEMAAVIVNAIIADSLEPGEAPDVIAVPAEQSPVPVTRTPEEQELTFVRAQSELHAKVVEFRADGVIDEKETGVLRRLKAREDREFDNLLCVAGGARR